MDEAVLDNLDDVGSAVPFADKPSPWVELLAGQNGSLLIRMIAPIMRLNVVSSGAGYNLASKRGRFGGM